MLEDLFIEIEKNHSFEFSVNPLEIDDFEKSMATNYQKT